VSSFSFAAEIRDVSKRVRDGADRRTIIDSVSFGMSRGDFVVLRGPSGSGKTTLLALVGAMLSPTSGEVLLDGEPTSRLRESHRAEVRRHKVGFLFQDQQLVPEMSAYENVLLPCVPDGVTAVDRRHADALIERFSLEKVVRSAAASLSGGERQRVGLARALIRNPPILLLDEPTAHLDDRHTRALVHQLAALAAEDRGLLVATHDPRVVAFECVSRVLDLADGKLASQISEDPA
jgi:putative ABC transport system ATP-binding protein